MKWAKIRILQVSNTALGGVFPFLDSILSSYCHSKPTWVFYSILYLLLKMKNLLGKKQNFKCIFLKTKFFNFQTLKRHISANFWAKKLNEVS